MEDWDPRVMATGICGYQQKDQGKATIPNITTLTSSPDLYAHGFPLEKKKKTENHPDQLKQGRYTVFLCSFNILPTLTTPPALRSPLAKSELLTRKVSIGVKVLPTAFVMAEQRHGGRW